MYLPIHISWLLDLVPVSTDRKLVFPRKIVAGDLAPIDEILVEVEPTPPLELAGNIPVLPPVPALDVQILSSAVAGRIRGLLLA